MRDAYETAIRECEWFSNAAEPTLGSVVPIMMDCDVSATTMPEELESAFTHARPFPVHGQASDDMLVWHTPYIGGVHIPWPSDHDVWRVAGCADTPEARDTAIIWTTDADYEPMSTIVVRHNRLTTDAAGLTVNLNHDGDLLRRFKDGYALGRIYASNRAAAHAIASSYARQIVPIRSYADFVRSNVSYELAAMTGVEGATGYAYISMWVTHGVSDSRIVDVDPSTPVSVQWLKDALECSKEMATHLFDERVRSLLQVHIRYAVNSEARSKRLR
jgi:hypothetical protein